MKSISLWLVAVNIHAQWLIIFASLPAIFSIVNLCIWLKKDSEKFV